MVEMYSGLGSCLKVKIDLYSPLNETLGSSSKNGLCSIIFREQNHVASKIKTKSVFPPKASPNPSLPAVHASSPGYIITGKYRSSFKSSFNRTFLAKSSPTIISESFNEICARFPVPVRCLLASFGCIKKNKFNSRVQFFRKSAQTRISRLKTFVTSFAHRCYNSRKITEGESHPRNS